jgi:hypothetical protein
MELIPRVSYNPAAVQPNSNRFLSIVDHHQTQGNTYVRVRITAAGNEALRELCHTRVQREVWSWPSYEFLVRVVRGEPAIKAAQVCSSVSISIQR